MTFARPVLMVRARHETVSPDGVRMSLADDDRSLLACPACHGSLRSAPEGLGCDVCDATYPVRDGTPDLIPWPDGGPGPEWARWRERLQRLQEWRRRTWDGSASAGQRQRVADTLAEEFFRFARVPERGPVLEIGCGSGDLRRFIPRRRYWGLDPLIPPSPGAGRDPADTFLRGVGERLPFADESFQTVLVCETLDHAMDPRLVINEARRVLKSGGLLAIMQSISLTRPPVPPLVRLRAAAGRLKARLSGQQGISDAETKVRILTQEELTAMVNAVFVVEAGITRDAVMFLRALKQDPAGPRIPKRQV